MYFALLLCHSILQLNWCFLYSWFCVSFSFSSHSLFFMFLCCLSVCLSVCLFACLSVYLSVCLSACVSICLSVVHYVQLKHQNKKTTHWNTSIFYIAEPHTDLPCRISFLSTGCFQVISRIIWLRLHRWCGEKYRWILQRS